jgi:hypothetical protein
LIILPMLSFLGAFGTHVLSEKNGLYPRLLSGLAIENPLFPGTTDPMVSSFTGIGRLAPLDRQLQILVTFFAPVVDPANSALNLFSLHGLGQFGAAWCKF